MTTSKLKNAKSRLRCAHQTVAIRCRGLCECCAQPLTAVQFGHRTPRGLGGSSNHPRFWDSRNLLALCPPCHAFHEANREWSYDLGYLVPRHIDYTRRHVLIHGQRLVRLTTGGYQEAPVDDLLRKLYEERYSGPVRGRNLLGPVPPDPHGWLHLRELQAAMDAAPVEDEQESESA